MVAGGEKSVATRMNEWGSVGSSSLKLGHTSPNLSIHEFLERRSSCCSFTSVTAAPLS